jgi:alkanesulfonate monooxygenase SsuD/methylene tetrahydromethanopterin reductase-like flavin-dependent oxidoreductase (luciferase family)
MAAPLRLGFLTHLHGAGEPRQLFRDYVELFVAGEELGFDSGWVAQHHFDASAGGLPSPFPFLAAVAERTSRIRLGTAVVTLPLEDPIRVAEDAAVLDALSCGRVELGVGSGTDPATGPGYGPAAAPGRT